MKKLLFILMLPLFLFGCTMNTKTPSHEYVIKNASDDLASLTHTDYKEIQADFGTPHKAIYYIDTSNISSKDVDSLTLEDLRNNIITFASYKDPSNPSNYVNIFFRDGYVQKALAGNFEDLLSIASTQGYEYKVEFFKNKGVINEHHFILDDAQNNFVGKPLSEFKEYFDVDGPNFTASKVEGPDKLNFYPLVNQNLSPKASNVYPNYQSNHDINFGYINPINNNIAYTNKFESKDIHLYADKSVMVYTDKDNIVKYIGIANKDVLYGVITNMLGPVSSTPNSK